MELIIDNEQVTDLLTTALASALPIGFTIALIEIAVKMFYKAVTGRYGGD